MSHGSQGDALLPNDAFAALTMLVVLPLVCGILLGRYTRHLEAPRALGPTVFLAAPLLGLLAAWIPLGFWNLVFAGGVFATAYWVAAWAHEPARTLLALGVTVGLSLCVLELASRLFLSDHPLLQGVGASQPRLYNEPTRAIVARGDIPILWPSPTSRPEDFRRGTKPYHLRVGDSMVTGDDLTDELRRRIPTLDEAEIGIPGSGPDIQLYVLSRWLQEASRPPVLVTHHVFAGNDIGNLDCDYDFCGGGGLLEYGPDGPVPCRHLEWKYSAPFLIAESPPPYVLGLASGFSTFARIGIGALRRVGNKDAICKTINADDPRPDDWDLRWTHFESIMRSERDMLDRQGIRLVAVVVPYRPSLESGTPESTGGYEIQTRMVETLRRLHIHTLDAWPLFRAAVTRDGSEKYFRPNRDIHWRQSGTQLYAAWLAEQLVPDLEASASLVADEGVRRKMDE